MKYNKPIGNRSVLKVEREWNLYDPNIPYGVFLDGEELEMMLWGGNTKQTIIEPGEHSIHFSFLHMGDTEATAEEIGSLDLRDRHIDVAFVPFWLLEERRNARSYLEAIGAATVVAMHIPASDAPPSYLAPGKDLEDLIRILEDITPEVVILPQVMATRVFTSGTS